MSKKVKERLPQDMPKKHADCLKLKEIEKQTQELYFYSIIWLPQKQEINLPVVL